MLLTESASDTAYITPVLFVNLLGSGPKSDLEQGGSASLQNSNHPSSSCRLNPVAFSEYAAADLRGPCVHALSRYGFATVYVWNLPRGQEKMEPPRKGAGYFCFIPCARFDATPS